MEINKQESKTFELVVYVKDNKGNPTQKRISKSSDNAYEIFDFWNKHKPTKKRKGKPTTKKEAEKILKGMNQNNV